MITSQRLAHVGILVDDYDKSVKYYTEKLGFFLLEDTKLTETKRWVVVSPTPDLSGTNILLIQATKEEEITRIGSQTGSKVGFFLYTDNMELYFNRLVENDVQIIQEPIQQPWGKVAVFADLYGNLWDLIESKH